MDGPRRRRAFVRAVAASTPLEEAPAGLADRRPLFLKREDVHELGAFKWRGALPVLERYRANGADAVVTASTGNHGAATAWAAQRVGMGAIVYAPEAASPTKLAHVERFGATLVLTGVDLDGAKEEARAYAEKRDVPFFEDGAEREQYFGYQMIGAEILADLDEPPAAVVVPVGNGALLGGIGIEICRRSPNTERIGVAAKQAPVMARSWEEGHVVEGERGETFADGLAVRVAVPLAVRVLGEVATGFVLVSERAMAEALGAYARAGIRVEGAAAAALAALPEVQADGPIVLVVTGRNIDDELFTRALERPDSFPD
ncbi:MAG: pyridoxal-phosphate dependent enzyme [Actinomycetota bacterium]|nr:pyridoxal-phosphate dependent enzyme [Actinomycetota bacterium]